MTRSVDQAYASPQVSDAALNTIESPTSVRYRIIALSMCMSLILYLDRFALNPITATIVRDLGIDKEQFGRGNLIFFWAYALFQVPAGALADRFGARRMLALYVIAWSLATIALGFVPGLVGLLGLRAVMGAAQAGAYPAAGSFLKRWANPTARAKANSLVAAGGRCGAVVALALTAWLSLQFHQHLGLAQGWRGTLMLYGGLGIAWSALFWWYFRDSPAEHPGCNPAEVALVGSEGPQAAPARLPLAQILVSLNVWLLSLGGFLVNVGWIFLAAWQTTYILETFEPQLRAMFPNVATEEGKNAFKEVAAGVLTAVAFCAGITGGVAGGIAADIFLRRFGPIWGRRVPGLLAGCLAGVAYLCCPFITDMRLFVAVMLFTSFMIDFGLGSLWATYQDIGGKHVGSVLGFANMWGNFGAGLCGWLYGWLAKEHQWPAVFFISAVALFLMSSCWFLVNPTHTIVPSDSERGYK